MPGCPLTGQRTDTTNVRRNPIAELAFDALMHKYFHLSAVAGEEFVVAIRNLPQMQLPCIRMLTWGLLSKNA